MKRFKELLNEEKTHSDSKAKHINKKGSTRKLKNNENAGENDITAEMFKQGKETLQIKL